MSPSIAEFDALDQPDADALVRVWAAVPGWISAIVENRPFGTVEALTVYAEALAAVWTRDDLDHALTRHPRIGERATGSDAEADASRAEQSSMTDAGTEVRRAIAEGNAAYEARFGRVFLIRAAGRTPGELRAELERRLGNDDDTEAREATAQLAEIALLRLRESIHGLDDPVGADDPETTAGARDTRPRAQDA